MEGKNSLFLIDGHAMVYRAHYAFIQRPLLNSKGQNVSAINGFIRSIWDIITNVRPTHLGVVFDPKGGTFRNEIYSEYKANRDAQPEDISFALPYIHTILVAMNIPVLTVPNYEADDVIGTLAKMAEHHDIDVFMVTPDKDYAQLVSSRIFQYKPARLGNEIEILGIDEILNKWQIEEVSQVIDILGLQGDAVDNIPGVPGIGEKTAIKLLKEYKNIENIIENSTNIKGKVGENIKLFADQARLSKLLATIKLDVPIDFHLEDFKVGGMDKEKISDVFNELEFRTLSKSILGSPLIVSNTKAEEKQNFQVTLFEDELNDLLAKKSHIFKTINDVEHHYKAVINEYDWADFLLSITQAPKFCFDTETTGLDTLTAQLVGIAFCFKAHHGYYIPIPENKNEAQNILKRLKPFFENSSIPKIGQNLKYDISILRNYDINVVGELLDTMIMHYLLEPDLRHGMDYLAESYLNYRPIPIEELIGEKKSGQISMAKVDLNKITNYAVEDADITFQLYEHFYPLLIESGSLELFNTIESPFIYVLVALERNGVKIDDQYLNQYSTVLEESILELEQKIFEKAGLNFNIASPRQIGDILFDHLKIPYRWSKTKSGQFSTDEEKLSELSAENDIVALILDHRSLSKLKSTYVDSLPKMIHPKTNRIHSSFNQALAATGRLSSNNPNLQNIPIKSVEGRKIREAFIPKNDDFIIISADYSQIELRLIAELSKDETLVNAFKNALDIHTATAAKVYSVSLEEVNSDQRRNAKTVNFSIIYGAGATNLSSQLGIKRSEAKEIIDQYFKEFSGLKSYMDSQVNHAREHGFVKTLCGRKRILRDINSRNALARSGAERVAINSPIQGTAADLIKAAMIKIHTDMTNAKLKSMMIMQVHDELVFDVKKDEIEQMEKIISNGMKNAITGLIVPIEISLGHGQNWLEAH